MPQDSYNHGSLAATGMVHRNPFQNPSPSPSLYDEHTPLPSSGRTLQPGGYSSHSRTSSKQDVGANLSITYLPSKFSRPHSPGISYRKAQKNDVGVNGLKTGGGTGAFASGVARMPAQGDEDYDGVDPGAKRSGRLHWNRFKWILFSTNTLLTIYSLGALIFTLLVWFDVWTEADVIRVGNAGELQASTVAACYCILTALFGWAGIVLNNRAFLAVYTVNLWISFGLLVVPGYLTYKRRTFNLEGKVNAQWSRNLGVTGRLRIQNVLECCGYYSPFVEASVSASCYSRSMLPGCKGPYLDFEHSVLKKWYLIVFCLVPCHLTVIVAALLCSNHVTYRFGKGMMPKPYRLTEETMAAIMEMYASQLADQYGEDAVEEAFGNQKNASDVALIDSLGYTGSGDSRDSSQSGNNSPTRPQYQQYGHATGREDVGYGLRDRGRRI